MMSRRYAEGEDDGALSWDNFVGFFTAPEVCSVPQPVLCPCPWQPRRSTGHVGGGDREDQSRSTA